MIDVDPEREPATPKHAATVLVLREEKAGFSVFMVRRHSKSRFMGGAYVFPGGKLDDADSDDAIVSRSAGVRAEDAATLLGEPDDPRRALGLFVAAARETFEESGVLLAEGAAPNADLDAVRTRLNEGADFASLLEEVGATLRLDRLVPYTRWVTPVVEPRRYDTRFFLTVAAPDQEAAHDRKETTEHAWLRPGEALAAELRGEIQLPPPTMRSLEMLARFDRVEAILEDARSRTPPLIEPVFLDADGVLALTLPGDPAHPVAEQRIPGPTRFVLDKGRWWSGSPKGEQNP